MVSILTVGSDIDRPEVVVETIDQIKVDISWGMYGRIELDLRKERDKNATRKNNDAYPAMFSSTIASSLLSLQSPATMSPVSTASLPLRFIVYGSLVMWAWSSDYGHDLIASYRAIVR